MDILLLQRTFASESIGNVRLRGLVGWYDICHIIKNFYFSMTSLMAFALSMYMLVSFVIVKSAAEVSGRL